MSLIYLLSPEKTSPRRLLSRLNVGDYGIEWFTVGVVKGIVLKLERTRAIGIQPGNKSSHWFHILFDDETWQPMDRFILENLEYKVM